MIFSGIGGGRLLMDSAFAVNNYKDYIKKKKSKNSEEKGKIERDIFGFVICVI